MAGYYSSFQNNQGMWNNNQPQNNGYNNYSWNGYPANPQITMEDAIRNSAFEILRNYINGRQINDAMANEVMNRINNNIGQLALFVSQNIQNNNGQCNTSDVYTLLNNNIIPNMLNEITNQMNRQAMYSNYNNNYNNFNNGYNHNNYQYQTTPMFSQPPVNNSAQVVSNTGIGREMKERAMQKMNSMFNAAQNNNPNPVVINNQQPTNTNTNRRIVNYNDSITTNEDTTKMVEAILKKMDEACAAYKKSINVDKLTSNTTELILNESLEKNNYSTPDTPELSIIEGNAIEQNTIKTIQQTPKDNPDYCETVDHYDYTRYGESVTTTVHKLKIPTTTCKEAVELIQTAFPDLTSTHQWFLGLEYKELVVKKLPKYAEEARQAFKEIGESLSKLNDINDINNVVLPIINKQRPEVQEYLTDLAIDRINKLFKIMIYIPGRPDTNISISSWSHIFKLLDRNSEDKGANQFVNLMYSSYEQYPEMIFICVKSALKDVFWCDEEKTTITTKEKENIGLLARCSDITSIVGKYRISDYGWMPENYKTELLNTVDRDYIVHKYPHRVVATNIDVQSVIGTKSRFTCLKSSLNLYQSAFIGLVAKLSTKTKYDRRDISLVQFDQKGETIIGYYTVSINDDNVVIIENIIHNNY